MDILPPGTITSNIIQNEDTLLDSMNDYSEQYKVMWKLFHTLPLTIDYVPNTSVVKETLLYSFPSLIVNSNVSQFFQDACYGSNIYKKNTFSSNIPITSSTPSNVLTMTSSHNVFFWSVDVHNQFNVYRNKRFFNSSNALETYFETSTLSDDLHGISLTTLPDELTKFKLLNPYPVFQEESFSNIIKQVETIENELEHSGNYILQMKCPTIFMDTTMISPSLYPSFITYIELPTTQLDTDLFKMHILSIIQSMHSKIKVNVYIMVYYEAILHVTMEDCLEVNINDSLKWIIPPSFFNTINESQWNQHDTVTTIFSLKCSDTNMMDYIYIIQTIYNMIKVIDCPYCMDIYFGKLFDN